MSLQGVKLNPEASKEDLRRMSLQINQLVESSNGNGGNFNLGVSPVLTGDQNISDLYSVYICDASTGVMTLTPPIIDDVPGRTIWVKKIDSSGNSVVWNAPVDGSTSATITVQYTSLTFNASAGSTRWWVI
jgi:hypothetical protein